jgi:2-methylcitrate dehydratase PrpD
MRDMKQAAQIWLGRSKATAEAAKALAKEKEAQAKIESLEIAVREQAERIEQLIKDRAK